MLWWLSYILDNGEGMPRVYIGRLGPRVREKDVQRFFGGYGKLMEIDLKNGFGFVEFDDNRDADDAVYELNGRDLCGERVVVEYARGSRRDLDGGGRSNAFRLKESLFSEASKSRCCMFIC
uniref:Serine and arginine rich splicing factor 6 n=1 Tax=Gadus morhua TaxID=8049 RepID=A0A8C5AGJ5_GADMO